jgi:hypothetical protein
MRRRGRQPLHSQLPPDMGNCLQLMDRHYFGDRAAPANSNMTFSAMELRAPSIPQHDTI